MLCSQIIFNENSFKILTDKKILISFLHKVPGKESTQHISSVSQRRSAEKMLLIFLQNSLENT